MKHRGHKSQFVIPISVSFSMVQFALRYMDLKP